MRYLLIAAALIFCHPVMADQPETETVITQQDDREHFEGTWITVRNRKLDGRMDCFSVRAGDKWRARFAGVWQGVKFEYTVDFDGPPEKLVGHPVTIDGARYKWTGEIKNGRFKGTFESPRYDGTFDLKKK